MTQPTSAQSLAKLLSNPDVANQVGPSMASALVQSQAQANAPITPFQQAGLNNQADERSYQRRQAEFAQLDQGSTDIQNAMDASVTIPKFQAGLAKESAKAAAISDANFPNAARLAQIRADAAATNQGDFGRSLNGKSYAILSKGTTDPAIRATPEYATAYAILSNPHIDANTGTIITPDLSMFAPPTGGQPAPGPGQPPQGAPTGAPGAPPPQRMPSVQSFAPPNPSQPEAASAGYANRLNEAAGIIDKNQESGTSLYNRAASSLPGGNYVVGSEYQQLDQAERNFVNAQLRRESGAAISESEFKNARQQYFPQPGDKPEVLAQKKKARDMAVQNMQLSAGNVLLPPGVVQQSSPPKGAPMVPQQQGFGASAPQSSGGWKIERVQ